MGHRLSKIYTRTGDEGTTGLGDGSRVPKNSFRIAAIGEIDELNCTIGLLRTSDLRGDLDALMLDIQHDLFDLGGELAIPGSELIQPATVEKLEKAVDLYNEELPPLKEFLLPGGSQSAGFAHLARAVCRRAERALLTLAAHEAVSGVTLQFVNRLSDLLFVASRIAARDSAAGEVLWQRQRAQ